MAKQFLDSEGLSSYDALIKKYIDDADAKSIKAVAISEDGKAILFYKEIPVDENSIPDFTVELPDIDASELMKLVADAIEEDIAVFDADGQVIDSDTKISDLATMEYVGVIPVGYEATTIAEYAKELADNVAANGYDDAEIKARLTTLEEEMEEKADKTTTLEGYGIEDAYTKDETNEAIAEAVANADHLKREIVDELPDVAEADTNTIYMLHKEGEDGDAYDEYMIIDGVWEKIGSSEVDLTDYATKEYVDEAKAEIIGTEEDEAGTTTIYGAVALAQEALDAVDEIEAIPTEDIEALFE